VVFMVNQITWMDIETQFDALVECCEFLKTARADEHMDKGDVIDSIEMRVNILLRRGVCCSTFPYMSMTGWQVVTEIPSSE
jgi:hypothetical protein